jgi:ABC-type multidrug transport system fused ATPase/permease subunit
MAGEAKPILLLDEATSSLDPETESVVQDIIQEEFTDKGHTVIIVAHRVSALAKGMRQGIDAVVWMKDGRIEKVGGGEDIVDLGTDSEAGKRVED